MRVATLTTMRRIPSAAVAAVAAMQNQQTTDHLLIVNATRPMPCHAWFDDNTNKPCCVVSSGTGDVTSFLLVLSFHACVADLPSFPQLTELLRMYVCAGSPIPLF